VADDDNKYLERVRGLLAKAESTEFPEEADSLTEKAMALMAKYQLDIALLGDLKVTPDDVNSRTIRAEAPYAKEKYLLLNAIAGALDSESTAAGPPGTARTARASTSGCTGSRRTWSGSSCSTRAC
jgi:hypothetical protein